MSLLPTLARGVASPLVVAPPSRSIAPRAHATSPVPFAASLSQRNQQQRLLSNQLRRRHRRRRPATTSTTSASVAVSSSSSSPSDPQLPKKKRASTPVEGAVALVLECISLARKTDVEGLSARCRYPPPPGSISAEEEEETRGPLAPFAASAFDGAATRVLPGNLLRRAAVLSALELAPGNEEREEEKEEGERDNRPRGSARRRVVLVRTRVVSRSGEEATLLWRAERDEEEDGCWLVASVGRDDENGGEDADDADGGFLAS